MSRKGLMLLVQSSVAMASQSIINLCAPLLPDPGPACECYAERLRVGNSNILHQLTRRRGQHLQHFLVRQFGASAALALDREAENEAFARLAERGIAPPLVATFEGGRIEGWIDGRPCSAAECRSPDVYESVGRALATLHRIPLEGFDRGDVSGDWGWRTANTWLKGARSSAAELGRLAADGMLAEDEHSLINRVQAIDLDKVGVGLDSLRAYYAHHPELVSRCYCHNDLSNTNCHHDVARGVTHLLDFEFGGVNTRGFDLATHLSHWAGGAIDGYYDDDAFPTVAERDGFLRSYLGANRTALAPSTATDLVRLEAELVAALPLAHCVWGLWALCALPSAVASGRGWSFSHIEYAERRLAAFHTALMSAMDADESETARATSSAAGTPSRPILSPKPRVRRQEGAAISDRFRPDTLGGGTTEGTRW